MSIITNTSNILDELLDHKYHSSIIFSYSFDLLFYERYILNTLRSNGCKNNLVITDADKYHSNMILNYSNDSLVGKNYSIIPRHCKGSYHPKIIALFGDKSIKYLIGSGNLNLGGYSKNLESFYKIEFEIIDSTYHSTANKIWKFIKEQSLTNVKLFTSKQLLNIEQEYAFLNSEYSYNNTSQLAIDFMAHTSKESILTQFIDKIKGGVENIIVVSPFYDKDSYTIDYLIKKIKPAKCEILVQEDTTNLNKNTFPKKSLISIYKVPNSYKQNYLHAKIYIVVTGQGSHLLIGSANCTRNGLGVNNQQAKNVEACIYDFNVNKNYWIKSLNIDKLISSANKTKLSLISLKYTITSYRSKGYEPSLITIEYSNGKFVVLVDNLSNPFDGVLVLLDEERKELTRISSPTITDGIIIYSLKKEIVNYPALGYLEYSQNKSSNCIAISYQRELIANTPKPSLSILYEVLDKYKNNLIENDITYLLEPIQKLIEYDAQKAFSDYSAAPRIHNDDTESDVGNKAEIINYEDFIKKEAPSKTLKFNLSSDKTDLGLLIRYLLSRIGIIPSNDPNYYSINKKISNYNNTIYDEEESENDLRNRPEEYYNYANKKHIRSLDVNQVRYYRMSIKKLGKKFSDYLFFLNYGDIELKIAPPTQIESSIIFKYMSVLMLINYFAGREYKVDDKIYEGMSIDEGNYCYSDPALFIIGQTLCYTNKKKNCSSIFQRAGYNIKMIKDNDDLFAMVMLSLFTLSSLNVLYKNDGDIHDVKITFLNMYYELKLDEINISAEEIGSYFTKYFSDCGFFQKRNPFTQSKIITLENVIDAYHQMKTWVTENSDKISQSVLDYENKKGTYEVNKKVNQLVYEQNIGLTFIEEIRSTSVVGLYNYGPDTRPAASSFVLTILNDF